MESFNIDNYLEKLILRCEEAFSGRLVYVGLQGSKTLIEREKHAN